jgi:hypothetical protein
MEKEQRLKEFARSVVLEHVSIMLMLKDVLNVNITFVKTTLIPIK